MSMQLPCGDTLIWACRRERVDQTEAMTGEFCFAQDYFSLNLWDDSR